MTFATARHRQHRSLGLFPLFSTTRGHFRGFSVPRAVSRPPEMVRSEEHTRWGAALHEVEPVVRRARSPRAGFSTPRRLSSSLGPRGERETLTPRSVTGLPNDLGSASPHTPRRVHSRCKPRRLTPTVLGHDPRRFGDPCCSRFSDSARMFPSRAARDASVTGKGRLASTGTPPLFPLPARPIPLRGESLR
jgi:hypothetical protein